jgi:hypothetical protein
MALKSGIAFPKGSFAGRRPAGLAILAVLWIASIGVSPIAPACADDPALENSSQQRDPDLPAQARAAIGAVKQQKDIQFDPPVPRPIDPPARLPFLNFNLSWLPYVILGVIGVALLVVLARYTGRRIAERKGADAKVGPITANSIAIPEAGPERDRTFDEIDALADSGAFTEAVHRLLLLVQERLRSRIEHGIQASLTSREILRRARLPQDAATAFATLVAAVEVSLFGMRAANAATYALCRENSRRVLAAAAEARA